MATPIERAFHVLRFNPNALSQRFYDSHLKNYDIDRRIATMRADGEWPPRIVMAERWVDLVEFLRRCDDPNAERYALTLHDGALSVNHLPIGPALLTR